MTTEELKSLLEAVAELLEAAHKVPARLYDVPLAILRGLTPDTVAALGGAFGLEPGGMQVALNKAANRLADAKAYLPSGEPLRTAASLRNLAGHPLLLRVVAGLLAGN